MDGNDRRRSQYGNPYQPPALSRPMPGQAMGPPSGDRFAQPTTPARSDIGRGSLTRPYMPNYPGYGYQDPQYAGSHIQGSSPMQGVEMQYQPAYMPDALRHAQVQGSPAPQQPQQQQQYAQYAPSSMLPPVAHQSLFDNSFGARQAQDAAVEVMANQFQVPQYLPQGQHAGATLGSSHPQYITSQPEQSSFGHVAVTRPSMQQSYATGPVDFEMAEQQQVGEPTGQAGTRDALEEGMRDYQQEVKATSDAILMGRVTTASEKLLAVSRWLVNSVTALGLHHDDESKHAERIGLWTTFNLCWEALGQKQKEITEAALRTRTRPPDMLSADNITSLMDDLVGMCDQLEQYGLVDFEMGIWEEQITHIFTVCLDLLPPSEARLQSGNTAS